MKLPILATLLCLPLAVSAEDCADQQSSIKISTRISLEGVSVSLTGATREDISCGRYQELLSQATKEARSAWLCDMLDRNCDREPVPEVPLCKEDQQNEPFWVCKKKG